ncbi:MAG: glutaminase [Bacteroidales bacterium]|nr:glutaminase [Bacteroidales bacterium]
MNYQEIIGEIYDDLKSTEDSGQVASIIPELAKIDPDQFGVYLTTADNREFGIGEWGTKFSIQSISKVFALSHAYQLVGDRLWKRVDVEPSGSPFNSLIQLETNNGIPRNPFMNAGALVVCDILIAQLENPAEHFLSFIREVASSPGISYSETIANSEKATGYRNIALCNYLKSFGNLENDPDQVLDFYFHICSIEMSCQELSNAFLFLVNDDFRTSENRQVLNMSQAKRVNAIMQTCGFYDESGEFAFRVGLPGKSGVGGGIIAVHPDKYCIAVWSPKLNKKGNSYRGMKFLELFTTKTASSIF